MGIRQWSEDERPRERLMKRGPESLTNAELLAIFLRSGFKGASALDVARKILGFSDDLESFWGMNYYDFKKVKGVGMAKAVALVAVAELGRRRLAMPVKKKKPIRSAREVADYLQPLLKDREQEIFIVLFLNQANYLKREEWLSRGGISTTAVDVRLIFKMALEVTATSMVLCHNHPGGSLNPSRGDVEVTQKVHEAGKLFDIVLIDHVIVSDQGYFSFAESGRLPG